jgi:dipeptidase E
VRLYLSSFRMGDHPEHLAALVGADSRPRIVIANAMDDAPADVRRAGVELELAALADIGLNATELDLRDYFGEQRRLRDDLARVSLAWLRGGNVFMLRYAMARCGADTVFKELLAEDALVYAGYSAGPCVLSPSLRGLELVDDPGVVTRIYGAPPVWDGLAVLDEAFVPHYRSPGHPETIPIDQVVARYRAGQIPYRTLHDGQVMIVNGPGKLVV